MSASPAPVAVAALLPLVDQIARRVQRTWPLPRGLAHEDLVSEGTVGLVEACLRFNNDQPCRLSTFAAFRIRGAMLDALRRRYSEVTREVLLGNQTPPGVWTLAETVILYGEVLRTLVSGLSESDQTLVLGRLEGFSFSALAKELGTSKASAFRQHKKVLSRLRTAIQTRQEPGSEHVSAP